VTLAGVSVPHLMNITVTISPLASATAAPIEATYTKAYLLSEGRLDADAGTAQLSVFGLYANHSNVVQIVVGYVAGQQGARLSSTIATRPWSGTFKDSDRIDVQARNSSVALGYSYLLVKHRRTGIGPMIFDIDGHVRWVSGTLNLDTQGWAQPASFWGNEIYFGNVSALMKVALDSTVSAVADYSHLGATFHHNIDMGKHGMMLEMDTDYNDTVRLESTVYEVSRSGALLNTWDLSQIVRDAMVAGGDEPSPFVVDGVDWCHQNAGTFWSQSEGASVDTLVISCREQFVIGVGYVDRLIKWILGDADKAWHTYPSLRAFALTLAAGTAPPIGQHSTSITSAGELMVFDNGLFSRNTDQSLPTGSSRNFSAVRKYVIDDAAMTATEVWTYEHGRAIYSPVCSGAYERGGSTFVLYSNEGGAGPITSPTDLRFTRMVGLGVDQRVGFEYKWRKYDRFCGEAWLADPISLSGLLFA